MAKFGRRSKRRESALASRTILLFVAAVIGLLVGFGAAYAYEQNQISSLQGSLATANESVSMLHAQMSATRALSLQPKAGQMIHSGWVIIASVGSGEYAISLHADGLKPPSSGGYIVEGVQRNASLKVVPIAANESESEFDAGANGAGSFWTVLMQNPNSSFEAIELVYLPGMNMAQATVVASAQL
jgi:hypothetical protein